MMIRQRSSAIRTLIILLVLLVCLGFTQGTTSFISDWEIQSSSVVGRDGSKLSTISYNNSSSWFGPVRAPCTVIACLLQLGQLGTGANFDPFYGENFSLISPAPYQVPWWYRAQFEKAPSHQQTILITLTGINYRADVWVNGKMIASSNTTVGAFRYFDLDVTQYIISSSNVIALLIYPPSDPIFPPSNNATDLAITFVDWAPNPPDNSMGIWREVLLQALAGNVSVRYPAVQTELTIDSTEGIIAHLTPMVELTNWADDQVEGVLRVDIEGIVSGLQQPVTLDGGETAQVFFSNDSFTALNAKVIADDLWWPWQMGPQTLRTITFTFTGDKSAVAKEVLSEQFGIRQVSSMLDANNNRVFQVNGKNILIRGAGWAPDLFLRYSTERFTQEMNYVSDMNLNAVRLEGKFENDSLWSIADEMGILMLPGLCCCDAWQHWKSWGPEQFVVSAESVRSQLKRLRIHPSNLAFLYSSDELPPAIVEQNYLKVIVEEYWTAERVAAASAANSSLSGPTGVKMTGPYSWVPPSYWTEDSGGHQLGGAWGFLTEGGPGQNPLTADSMARAIPSDESQWPAALNGSWTYHCGNPQGVFRNLDYFTSPLEARYAPATSAADYLEKSQVAVYEAHRAMFEAYSLNKYTSTGVIQWMLNNAWPENIWHLYDYYLTPGAAYFATKKACERLHVMYSYANDSVYLVNSMSTGYQNIEVDIAIYNYTSGQVYHNRVSNLQIGSDAVLKVASLPSTLPATTKTYFLVLSLSQNERWSTTNTYWLSTVTDKLDWKHSTWYYTPLTQYADFHDLSKLPRIVPAVSIESFTSTQTTLVVRNPSSDSILFFVRLRLQMNGADVLPILWTENYFTLLPLAQMTVVAQHAPLPSAPSVVVECWNNISGANDTRYG